jgi:hypothetical protein
MVDSRPATVLLVASVRVSLALTIFRKDEFAFMVAPFRQRRKTTSRRRLNEARRKG